MNTQKLALKDPARENISAFDRMTDYNKPTAMSSSIIIRA